MVLVIGFLVAGLVLAIAAVFVVREAARMYGQPPPAVFDVDDAFGWVVQHLPDVVAATLTEADVRRILDFQMEFFRAKGVSVNGTAAMPPSPVIVGGAETVDYILERAAATGEAYLPEQVHAVVETEFEYLRVIGAVGPEAGDEGGAIDEPPEIPGGE